MDINKFFPVNNSVDKTNATSLVIAIVIYIAASIVVSFVFAVLSFIPVIGILLSLISWLFGLYCLVGLILAIIKFLN